MKGVNRADQEQIRDPAHPLPFRSRLALALVSDRNEGEMCSVLDHLLTYSVDISKILGKMVMMAGVVTAERAQLSWFRSKVSIDCFKITTVQSVSYASKQ